MDMCWLIIMNLIRYSYEKIYISIYDGHLCIRQEPCYDAGQCVRKAFAWKMTWGSFIELPSVLPKNTNSFPVYSGMQKYKNICDKQEILRSNLADSEFQYAILSYWRWQKLMKVNKYRLFWKYLFKICVRTQKGITFALEKIE